MGERYRPRRCTALHGQLFIQCEVLVTELSTHDSGHSSSRPDGTTLRWNNQIARRCICSDRFHALPGSPCAPVVEGVGARSVQVGGDHYKKFKHQPWDIIDEHDLNYYEGQVLKYLLRRKGNRLEDLKKARHVLDKLIEMEEGGSGKA
jgi:Protein of unknwon function (DUF3310).